MVYRSVERLVVIAWVIQCSCRDLNILRKSDFIRYFFRSTSDTNSADDWVKASSRTVASPLKVVVWTLLSVSSGLLVDLVLVVAVKLKHVTCNSDSPCLGNAAGAKVGKCKFVAGTLVGMLAIAGSLVNGIVWTCRATIQQRLSCQCVQQGVDKSRAGNQGTSNALVRIWQAVAAVCHAPHTSGG